MSFVLLALLVPGLVAMGLCWWLLPVLTRNSRVRWLLQSLLLVVGAALGLVYASSVPDVSGSHLLWMMLAAVGVVHIPAAAILVIK